MDICRRMNKRYPNVIVRLLFQPTSALAGRVAKIGGVVGEKVVQG